VNREPASPARISSEQTSTFPRFLDLAYPSIEGGDGVWLSTTSGERILDACSGGAMVTILGHGVQEVIDAGARQSERIAYYYAHHFTNEPQEQLAERLISVAAPEMARVRFVSSGSEANETALRLARTYHVDRGEPGRWRVISPAQAYHGSTMATLALSGRKDTIQEPYSRYLPAHLHIPPSTWRLDPSGQAALDELDKRLEEAGPASVAAFFCEPISAAALPAYSPPERFWHGLAERREKHGFLVCFDEIVTGVGRVGSWFAYQQLPIEPDIVTAGKGLGAGHAPLCAVLCRQHVYDAIAAGSRAFDLGHTWDGAPLSCATGLAVLEILVRRGLVERVRERGPSLRAELESHLRGNRMVREVRGRGFLFGVELVDPRDGRSFLPDELQVAHRVEDAALDHGLLVSSTHSTPDGYAGDEILLAPAYTSTDEELAMMVERFAETMADVASSLEKALPGRPAPPESFPPPLRGRAGWGPNAEVNTDVEFVLLGFPDVNGSLRGKALRPAAFESALHHGAAMTDLLLALDPVDAPIADYERFGIRSGAADLLVYPDSSTLHELQWRPGWRVCLGTPHWPDGRPCELASREVLRGALTQMAEVGYEVLSAVEYEVRLRDAEGRFLSSGLSYSLAELGGVDSFVRRLRSALEALGVELSAIHTEAAPGLLELNLAPRPALQAADDATFTKYAVKAVAASMGMKASFLAKVAAGEEGSSGHLHVSCWSHGRNAFAGAAADAALPAAIESAIAGVLEHLPAASLLLNPTINSYKRLVPGWFAPVNVSWGLENRSSAVRAIRSTRPELCRFECRRPGADANPYLALAAVVVSAADGLRRGARPPAPVEGDAYARADLPMLPGSLEAALGAFESDGSLRRGLGEGFSDYYITSRRWELRAWQEAVTDWELNRYERSV
jgi:glutamine synthetase